MEGICRVFDAKLKLRDRDWIRAKKRFCRSLTASPNFYKQKLNFKGEGLRRIKHSTEDIVSPLVAPLFGKNWQKSQAKKNFTPRRSPLQHETIIKNTQSNKEKPILSIIVIYVYLR
jgi:hypothetical protein